MTTEIPEQAVLYTHSIKIEDTAKGIRISVHVYSNDQQTAIDQTIETYLNTRIKAESVKIPIAPMEISSK